jgi:hypothetical protein
MTFEAAIERLKNGFAISRIGWNSTKYIFIEDVDNLSDSDFVIVTTDIFATDWRYGIYDGMTSNIIWIDIDSK